MSHRIRRITMDWDFKNPIKVLFYLNRTLKFLSNKKLERLIIKRSKRGYHVFLWTRASGNKLKIRNHLGDDKKHLSMDKLHIYGRQTLFSKKRKYRITRRKSNNK